MQRHIDAGLDPARPLILCWLDGLVSGRELAETLLYPLTDAGRAAGSGEALKKRLLAGGVCAWSVKDCSSLDELSRSLSRGCCALIFGGALGALCFELRAQNGRAVGEPNLEKSVKGAKDAFVETLRVNTALLRRRLATPQLKLIEGSIGRRSATNVALMYLEGVANAALVNECARRLDAMDIDALLSLGPLEEALADAPRSPFPQLLHTERPDRFAMHLSDGRVGLLVDGLPVGLVLPTTLAEFMKVSSDRSLFIIDPDTAEFENKHIRLSAAALDALKIPMEKAFGPIGPDLPYALRENPMCRSVGQFIEYVHRGVHDKTAQQRAFGVLANNSDGTCGEKVHRYIMEQLGK